MPFLPFLLPGKDWQGIGRGFALDQSEAVIKDLVGGRLIQWKRRRVRFFAVEEKPKEPAAGLEQLGDPFRVIFPKLRWQPAKKGAFVDEIETRRFQIVGEEISKNDAFTQFGERFPGSLDRDRREINCGDVVTGAMKGLDGTIIFATSRD